MTYMRTVLTGNFEMFPKNESDFAVLQLLEGMYQIAAGHGIYFFWSQSEPLGTRNRKDASDFIRFQGIFGGASARSQTAFPMIQTLGRICTWHQPGARGGMW